MRAQRARRRPVVAPVPVTVLTLGQLQLVEETASADRLRHARVRRYGKPRVEQLSCIDGGPGYDDMPSESSER
jgi:hypothetical protein